MGFSSLSACVVQSDGIDRDKRITPDWWRRNNWTMVWPLH